MEKALRSSLYNTIIQCRQLLEADFRQQLEGHFGIHPDGTVEPIDKLKHLDAVGKSERKSIEVAIQHETRSGANLLFSIDRFIRESAFTFLNRLAALKLFEHPSRGILIESISAGDQSKGFKQFARVSPEAMRGQSDGGYQLYLQLMFQDLSHVLSVIFDNMLPIAILFPTQRCLHDVLAQLNDPNLEAVWGEDETLGWIYQYFTPSELRHTARSESAAPRNSYELSFRNQFFTPRYVVEFLVENTLGRMWWQMRGGNTQLTQQCRYLITRNAEMPLNKRDPRTFRILDPACGSGHFLLYCYDLLEIIYLEAYEDADLGKSLRIDYPDIVSYKRAIPEMILKHNLFGVDIDLRATQIAQLALWLRAQKSYAGQGIKKINQRPRLSEIHIVCAEPMPGEYDLLGEFTRDLRPNALGTMLFEIWQEMKLAGEAGSLLKIEKAIKATIEKTRKALEAIPEYHQLTLFGPDKPRQLALSLQRSDLEDQDFWRDAEQRVVQELRKFAQKATAENRTLRRLFADDAIQGMALIDLLRQKFDVVLMNPPFGASSIASKDYIAKQYPRTKNDLYAAFVERGLELLCLQGYMGAITSRTGFFLSSFQKWREGILLDEAHFITMADLGYGVLDTAMVETAAYVVQRKEDKND